MKMKTKEQLVSLGLTEMKADEVMLLESKMLETAVKFQFKKKDGSVRDAIGTLCRDRMIEEDGSVWQPKGEMKPDVPVLMKYWDLGQGGWRCFNVLNFIAMDGA